jgi:hypothetical protein
MKNLFLGLVCLLCIEKTYSQSENGLVDKMAGYSSLRSSLLFVHTDKDIYINNEFIWFSAYLLHCGQDSFSLHRLLCLTLVQADSRTSVVQQKFAMANGLSYGSIQLPDSIMPGEYKLIASTNVIGSDSIPVVVYTHDLSVRSLQQPGFNAVMSIEENPPGRKNIAITISDKTTNAPIRNSDMVFRIGDSIAIHTKTDKHGEFRRALPELPPGSAINVSVRYHGELIWLQKILPAPAQESRLNIRFYPEGGNLLAKAPCKIGWESKTTSGEPLAIRAVLFKNNIPLDTIGTDERGLGTFILSPDPAADYHIKVSHLPAGVHAENETYRLPPVLLKGMALHMPEAVADDSLKFRIHTAGYPMIRVLVHNFRTVFELLELEAKTEGTTVLLLLDKIPRGLTAVTLLDSLNNPLAERIFFAHYNAKAVVQVESDKKIYEKREKVTLRFRLNNAGVPSAGFASVSCAQANRFADSKLQDIETFAFLQAELHDLPAYNGRGYNDTEYIENILLVKGWRRYTWTAMFADTIQQPAYYSPAFSGTILPANGRIRKPVTVTLLGGNTAASIITTDANGNFVLTYDQLLVRQDKRLWINAGNGNEAGSITIKDPFNAIHKKVVGTVNFHRVNAGRFLQHSQELALDGMQTIRHLAPVTIISRVRRDAMFHRIMNECGDYVCRYNILNCSNHFGDPGGRAPEKGKAYHVPGSGITVYWGCVLEDNSNLRALFQYDGIKIGKEFYAENFNGMVSGNPEYISTIYWTPALLFDKEGKAECVFHTSDITGRFRIVINGITDNNYFFATGVFGVK